MKNHKIPSFFKSRRPQGFNYKPRYYNQQRYELAERIDRIKSENTEAGAQARVDLDKYKFQSERHSQKSSSRVVFIAGIIGLTIYFYFTYAV